MEVALSVLGFAVSTLMVPSVQTWSPYMARWAIDGTALRYSTINCLGDEKVTKYTLADGKNTWDVDN